MIKIESVTLEGAYKDAASTLECSVTELKIEVVQYPSKGILGLFSKKAIIVAIKESKELSVKEELKEDKPKQKQQENRPEKKKEKQQEQKTEKPKKQKNKRNNKEDKKVKEESKQTFFNDTIMPESFVSTQDDDNHYEPVYADEQYDEDESEIKDISNIAQEVKKDINVLFDLTCFNIDKIEVNVFDENTLLIEFKGEDAALLIGKEGYRYKALSYMMFNWINTKYQVQLRLEIAEFLKNQEESVSRYLEGVCESVDRDGRAQTKILDGVLVQIALKELRDIYPDKYVAIRSTRDGMKYIIVNDYHAN